MLFISSNNNHHFLFSFYCFVCYFFFERRRKEEKEDWTPLVYPIFCENAKEIRKHLARKNIFFGNWYTETFGNCPNAKILSEKSLNFPTHIGITEKDAEKIYFEFCALRDIIKP